jgi:hypothetical protein
MSVKVRGHSTAEEKLQIIEDPTDRAHGERRRSTSQGEQCRGSDVAARNHGYRRFPAPWPLPGQGPGTCARQSSGLTCQGASRCDTAGSPTYSPPDSPSVSA